MPRDTVAGATANGQFTETKIDMHCGDMPLAGAGPTKKNSGTMGPVKRTGRHRQRGSACGQATHCPAYYFINKTAA